MTAAVTPSEAGGDFTVTAGSLSSVSLDRTSGATVTITLTAGASGATVTGLRLRAQEVSVDNTIDVKNSIDDGATGRPWNGPIRAEISVNEAQGLVNSVVSRYSAVRPLVTFTFAANRGDAAATQALSRAIGDRITIVDAQTGLNDPYWIRRIAHQLRPRNLLFTTFGCEEVGNDYGWILNTSVLNTDTIIAH